MVEARARGPSGRSVSRAETSGTPGGKPEESAAKRRLGPGGVATSRRRGRVSTVLPSRGRPPGGHRGLGSTGGPLPYRWGSPVTLDGWPGRPVSPGSVGGVASTGVSAAVGRPCQRVLLTPRWGAHWCRDRKCHFGDSNAVVAGPASNSAEGRRAIWHWNRNLCHRGRSRQVLKNRTWCLGVSVGAYPSDPVALLACGPRVAARSVAQGADGSCRSAPSFGGYEQLRDKEQRPEPSVPVRLRYRRRGHRLRMNSRARLGPTAVGSKLAPPGHVREIVKSCGWILLGAAPFRDISVG